jgi:hypothetical protein
MKRERGKSKARGRKGKGRGWRMRLLSVRGSAPGEEGSQLQQS